MDDGMVQMAESVMLLPWGFHQGERPASAGIMQLFHESFRGLRCEAMLMQCCSGAPAFFYQRRPYFSPVHVFTQRPPQVHVCLDLTGFLPHRIIPLEIACSWRTK